jgi:hypothetical protein
MFKTNKSTHPLLTVQALLAQVRDGLKDLGGFVFWVNVLSFLGLLSVLGMVLMVLSLSISTTWAQDQAWNRKVQPVPSDNLSAEQRLQAVRESLVQLALEGPTQVSSTSFIDESGTLRDSASFTHDMVVRGVRVLAYGQEAGETKAKIVADHQVPEHQRICQSQVLREKSQLSNILHLAVLEVAIDSTIKNSDLYTARLISRSLQENLLKKSDRSNIYRLNLRTMPMNAQSAYGLSQSGSGTASSLQANQTFSSGMNYYQQALLGRGDQKVTWTLSVKLLGARDEISGVSGMKVITRLENKLDRQFKFEDEQFVWFESKNPNLVTSVLSNVMSEQVMALANLIQRTVEEQLSCIPPQFEVTKWIGQDMSIAAGLINGLRQGDQMLVGDPQVIPSRILDQGSSNKLVLAEVKSVTPYSAELKQIAGPAVKAPEHWVAVAHRPFN